MTERQERNPTQEQIRKRCKAIQREWSQHEELKRRVLKFEDRVNTKTVKYIEQGDD